MKSAKIFSILLLLAQPSMGQDSPRCNLSSFISVDAKTGQVLSKWDTPGLSTSGSPFAMSPDGKAMYAGIRVCVDKNGKPVQENALPDGGRIVSSAITLSVPDLKQISIASRPDPSWNHQMVPLVSSDHGAISLWNVLLYLDGSGPNQKLKLGWQGEKPEFHVLPVNPKGAMSLALGPAHAFVFTEARILLCFDHSGKLLWKTTLGDGLVGPSPRIQIYKSADRFIVALPFVGLYAISGTSGDMIWKLPFDHWFSPPLISSEKVIVLGPSQ